MLWIDKKSYKRTLAVLRKEVQLPPLFIELKNFAEKEFGLTIYDITFTKHPFYNKPKKYFLNYEKKYQLIFQVSSSQDRETMQNKIYVNTFADRSAFKMEFDKQKHDLILAKFFELAKQYDFKILADKSEIWIDYYYFFSSDYMSYIVDKVERALKEEIILKYKKSAGIWQIIVNGYILIVFYKTEELKERNKINGISLSIKNTYYNAIKEKDEFDFYKDEFISFDTKENLDKNCNGSIFYYLR